MPPPAPRETLCVGCAMPIHFFGSEGFCRVCGGPLCPLCAQSRMTYSMSKTASVVPLVVVTLVRTVTIHVPVTVCRLCISDLGNKRAKSISRVWKWGVIAFIAAVVPSWFAYPVMAVLLGAAVFMVALIAYMIVKDEWIKEIVPCCPACGTLMARELFQAFAMSTGRQGLPNYVICTHCGYQGPRVPLDGLWRFVDNRGPAPLQGTFLQKPGQHSWRMRHGVKRRWWQIF